MLRRFQRRDSERPSVKTGDKSTHGRHVRVNSSPFDSTQDVDLKIFQHMHLDLPSREALSKHHSRDAVNQFSPHSGEKVQSSVPEMEQYSTMTVSSTVQDHKVTIPPAVDATRNSQDVDRAPLGEFLSRPIKIFEYTWDVGTDISSAGFNPWENFFENPRVANRLANFNLLRANLCLRFLINGNAFHYGRVLAYYRPLSALNGVDDNNGLVIQNLVQASQCPHVFLDPTTSQGGCLELPFFYHKNYMHVPTNDWRQMGNVFLRTLNPLRHANGADDRVTITVLANAIDVELSVLTNQPPFDLTPQSGELEQANTQGIISGPATMVSKVAGALSAIPYIRPYAIATQMIATATAKAARILGYCRPAMTKSPTPITPRAVSSLALTDVADTCQKLTVDSKQEVTIDPRISGIDSPDPLHIKCIAARESYLTKFTWTVGAAPETKIWNAKVQPTLWAQDSNQGLHLPACAFAALPFQYWTGTMKFRFQIVSSNYHKGRLRIMWDPNRIGTNEYNLNYQKIVDITEEKDFTVSISNGQEYTLLKRTTPVPNQQVSMYGTGNINEDDDGNGILTILVLNELTVPNTTVQNDIEVNVFVSMGDDFEVFVPNGAHQFYTFLPQSGTKVDPHVEQTTEPSAPEHMMSDPIFETHEESKLNMVFTGEAIASFRTLAKRFEHHRSIPIRGDTGNYVVAGRFSSYPYLRGNVPGALETTFNQESTNYCNTMMTHWITMPFAGWRGSLRWKFIPRGARLNHSFVTSYVTRSRVDDKFQFDQFVGNASSSANYSQAAYYSLINNDLLTNLDANAVPSGTLGTAVVNHTNIALEVEIPWQHRIRFIPDKVFNFTSQVNSYERALKVIYKYFVNLTGGGADAYIDLHHAIGDDFQTYFWTGMPTVWFNSSFPDPDGF